MWTNGPMAIRALLQTLLISGQYYHIQETLYKLTCIRLADEENDRASLNRDFELEF